MIDRTISHYKVTAELGRGGMGIVYKAEDTNLKRPVALKFLAAHLLGDKEVKARFRREAEAAAALNHPNVCHVYEISEVEGKTFIAMAFLEGEPLEKKIEVGPLKLKEALDFAIQTAKGLQAAHGKKIVHRDIKPANLMIGEDGHVTIMDFGLALLADRSKLTRLDETMGTVTYMSPEQTYGMELDHRTDVWSLGVVIYEMVTGQRPFKGHYDKAVMYSITNEEPEPMTALRTGVPMELELLVNKCLAKEADRRYQSTADMVVDLETLAEKLKSGRSTILRSGAPKGTGTPAGPSPRSGDAQAQAAPPAEPPAPEDQRLAKYRVIEDLASEGDSVVYRAEDTHLKRAVTISVLPESAVRQAERRRRLQRTAVAVGGALAMAVVLLAVQWLRGPAPAQPETLRRFAFTPESLHSGPHGRVAISPDGKYIVYLGGGDEPRLRVRDIGREQPRELAGTENAQPQGLFWSPDSQFIGFAADNELKKVSVKGGPAITLCPLPGRIWEGGAWSPGGDSIVFSSGSPPVLHEVPARGGEPKLLFEPETSEKGTANLQPHFLLVESGARSIVYNVGSYTDREIVVKNLETGEREVLADGAFPRYSPSGHILYQTAAFSPGLWALPFSLETLKPTGEAFPIAENAGDPSVAGDGTLAYVDFSGGGRQQLAWRDREGKKLEVIGQPQDRIVFPALSPDGRQVAVRGTEDNNQDVWVHDVGRSLKRRLTFDAATDGLPIWSPSGKEIAFRSDRGEGYDTIYIRPADGTGEPALLVDNALDERPNDWSPDGKYLLYSANGEETGWDLWYLKRKEDGGGFESVPFLQTSFTEYTAKFSPDGRFVAYVSDESGRNEVYVRPFPGGDGKWQVSGNGGTQPRWSKDGKELFYVERDTLMAVAAATTPSFTSGAVTRLFQDANLLGPGNPRYDVSADGRRFVLPGPVAGAEEKPPSIHVVENWYEEFKDRPEPRP